MDDASLNDAFLDQGASPSDYLRGLAARAQELQQHIDEYEAAAALLKKELLEITQKRMVDAMVQNGFPELRTDDGTKFALTAFVSGSLPKEPERRELAIAYLAEHGAGNLIKSELSIAFDKSQHNLAIATQQGLLEQGFPAQLTSGVHSQSLQAWAREKMKEGEDINFDVLGLNAGQYVKVTAPKGSK